MQKSIALLCGVLAIVNVYACDVCGGVSANSTIGFAPTNDFHYFGIRSNYRRFYSHSESMITGTMNSTEYFFQSDLVGKFQLSNRWQLIGIIPYSYVSQIENGTKSSKSGLGDISLMSFYSPLIAKDSAGFIRQQLNVGLGLKCPTGNYAESAHTMSNMYPGTGAFDIILGANYFTQTRKNGFQLEGLQTFRLENKYGYQYGSISTLSGNYFRVIKASRSVFRPFVGFQASYFGKDCIDRIIVTESVNHGLAVSGKIGLNYVKSNWFFSVSTQLPIYQNLGNGAVQQKESVQLSINYLISKQSKK
jgi:hypothetical protein